MYPVYLSLPGYPKEEDAGDIYLLLFESKEQEIAEERQQPHQALVSWPALTSSPKWPFHLTTRKLESYGAGTG